MDRPPDLLVGRVTVKAEKPPSARDPRWGWRAYWYDRTAQHNRGKMLGRCDRDEAERRAARLLADGLPSGPAPAPTELRTVADLIDTYAAHIDDRRDGKAGRPLAWRSHVAYEDALARLKHRGALAPVLLSALGKEHLEAWARLRVGEGAASSMTVGDVKLLLTAWRYAHDEGALLRRPLRAGELALPEIRDARPRRTPTEEEVAAVRDALPLRYAFMLELLRITGARIGEIAHLEWDDVDLPGATLHLGRHDGARKTRERAFPLLPEDVALLAAWRERGEWRPDCARWVVGVKPVSAAGYLSTLLRAAGGRFTAHGVRRWMEDSLEGSDPKVWAALLGHSELMALRRYRSATEDKKRAALRRARGAAVIPITSRR